MNKSEQILQIDNSTHPNKKRDQINARKVLEKAKQLNRGIVLLPKGYSSEFEKFKRKLKK